jgi:DNA-binding NarL/FixJ family response regulator
VQADDPRSGALVVRANGLLAALVALFEQCWSGATSLQADPQLDPATAPTRQERELLRTLAFGYTDDGAAQRLGVSTRTVRRLMAGLMERLDARSRFEAGIKVAERGWLSSDDGRHRSGPPPDAVAG